MRGWLIISLLVMMAGCAVTPTIQLSEKARAQAWKAKLSQLQSMDAWDIKGRVAVSNAEDSWSASLLWKESLAHQEVRVVAPLGQGSAIVKREGHGMTQLKLSNGRVFFGESASDLLHAQLGWYLPVESLVYWIKGMPDPTTESVWRLNEQGQVAAIEQGGWQVEYQDYRFADEYAMDLPSKMLVQREDWRIKLMVKNWQKYQPEDH